MRAKRLALLIVFPVALALNGCATLSKEECQSGNWQEIGQADGFNGEPESRLQEHAKACSSYSVAPNVQAYMAGREVGLASYCTPASGFAHGRAGDDYAGVCPPATAAAFSSGYMVGRKLWDAQQTVRRYESRVLDLENQLRRAEDDLSKPCVNDSNCYFTKQNQQRNRNTIRNDLDRERWNLSDARNRYNILEASVMSQFRATVPGGLPPG